MVYIPETTKYKAEFEPGLYRMVFKSYKGCRKRLWDDSIGRYSDTETEPGILLEWTDVRTGRGFLREEKSSTHEKSNLVKYAKWMSPKLFTKAVIADEEKFFTVLASLQGQEQMLSLGVNNKGSRNTLEGIMPVDGQTQQELPKPTTTDLASDEIPF